MLRERYPQADITFDSYRPQVDHHWYDARVVRRGLLLSWDQINYLKQADIVVWGGGALLADNACRTLIPYWLVIIAFVKLILRKPVIAWGHGLVIETKIGAFLARLALNLVDVVTVRDVTSYRTLQQLGVHRPAQQLTDPAILIRPAPTATGQAILAEQGIDLTQRPLLCLSPTFWMLYHHRRDWLPYFFARRLGLRRGRNHRLIAQYKHALTNLCQGLIQRLDAHVLLLPRYPCAPWEDVAHLQEVARAVTTPQHITVFKGDEWPPPDYLAIFRCLDAVISIALHDAIFATALDVPCVHLYYETKGRDFFLALNAAGRLRPWTRLFERGGIEEIVELTAHTLKQREPVVADMQPAKQRLITAARAHLSYFDQLLTRAGQSEPVGEQLRP